MKKFYLLMVLMLTTITSVFAQEPTFALEGTTDADATWYYIQFDSSSMVLTATADEDKAHTSLLSPKEGEKEAMLWRFIGNKDEFKLKNKVGLYLGFNSSSNRFTKAESSSETFKLYDDNQKAGFFQIKVNGATQNRSMNQAGDIKIGMEIGYYNDGNANNYLRFVPETKVMGEFVKPTLLPEFDPNAETWYQILFVGGKVSAVTMEGGEGENLLQKRQDFGTDNNAQLWQFVGTKENNIKLYNKNGRYIFLRGDGAFGAITTPDPIATFSLIDYAGTKAKNAYQLKLNSNPAHGLNAKGGIQNGKFVGHWNINNEGNALRFLKVSTAAPIQKNCLDETAVDEDGNNLDALNYEEAFYDLTSPFILVGKGQHHGATWVGDKITVDFSDNDPDECTFKLDKWTLKSLTVAQNGELEDILATRTFTVKGDYTILFELEEKAPEKINQVIVNFATDDAEAGDTPLTIDFVNPENGATTLNLSTLSALKNIYTNTEYTLKATANEGYEIVGFILNGNLENGSSLTFTATKSMTLKVKYKKVELIKVTLADKSTIEGGRLLFESPFNGRDLEHSFAKNTEITLTSETEEGYELNQVLVNGTDVYQEGEAIKFIVTKEVEVKPVYKKVKVIKNFDFYLEPMKGGTIKVVGYDKNLTKHNDHYSANLECDKEYTLEVTPVEGYEVKSIIDRDGNNLTESKKFTPTALGNLYLTVKFEKKTTTAVEGLEGVSYQVYPNPAVNFVELRGFAPNAEVRLIALTGKTVLSTKTNIEGSATLNVSELARGLYLVRSDKLVVKLQVR